MRVRAKKSLAQHFLRDPIIVNAIIEALAPRKGEAVIEIGPGEGVLTLPLINSGAQIIAVELDRRLAPQLEQDFAGRPNFRVIEADILTFNPVDLGFSSFAVIGNLPYNITTPIIDWLLANNGLISRAVFMMQKEVARRVISPPGRRARSTISVLTALYFDSEIVCEVPPSSFAPPPKVDSMVVKFVRHGRHYPVSDPDRFAKFVRFCFAGKRKTLLNNLNSAYPVTREEMAAILTQVIGSTQLRAEQLELDSFIALYDAVIGRLKRR